MTNNSFLPRHIGPTPSEQKEMAEAVGYPSVDAMIEKVVPTSIRLKSHLKLSAFAAPMSEAAAHNALRERASQNKVSRSFIGMGYYGCIVPPVIQRNILENPSWYTHYTPYQPEISQGRLEALLNFQTMVAELTGLPFTNGSLLDEGTAAAEGMALALAHAKAQGRNDKKTFFVSDTTHPQTIAVVKTRADALGVVVKVGKITGFTPDDSLFGTLIQCPDTFGTIDDYRHVADATHSVGALLIVATDLLALTLLTPPGEWGADVAVGSSQRFGVPLGYGGPHAGFFSVRDELKRIMPGRLVGVSRDKDGKRALRLTLQTREQHIRREKATSNICTAQVLLAVMAGMYAVYHGPSGLKAIATEVNKKALRLGSAFSAVGLKVLPGIFFDTVVVSGIKGGSAAVVSRAEAANISVRVVDTEKIGISLDEATTEAELQVVADVVAGSNCRIDQDAKLSSKLFSSPLARVSKYLTHEVFNRSPSETEFLRYVKRLESKDLSLATSMIPLGSCTMKLNATTEMIPVTWPEFCGIHPFVPVSHTKGYQKLFSELESSLREITGFAAISLQPNAGSQGELAGLLCIRAYHRSRGDAHRTICLIPKSAHGTNPASAVMAGMEVVAVECDSTGNVDLADLKARAKEHGKNLAALMVTYPSTHGVFEEEIREIANIVHAEGGQVYMDGANLNAQVGLCSPGDIGADVCHINLHKTFCIPHGGGGPGMGPIGVAKHLAPFLPNHPAVSLGHDKGIGPVSAAPWGSATILPISWAYIAMMAGSGLTEATKVAILNANYLATKLESYYPVLYRGKNGLVAHECILDTRPLKKSSGIEAEDIAKRLMDYGFHAPTVSFPVPGTLMIEPTESESLFELNRFIEAMILIREEIREVEEGRADRENNLLKNAPHTAQSVVADSWSNPYSRERAAYPTSWSRQFKFWPAVRRIDGVFGDRNLCCLWTGNV